MSPGPSSSRGGVARLEQAFLEAWPKALRVWSPFTKLRPPLLCVTPSAAEAAGLIGSFAMIRLADQSVVIDLTRVERCGLADFALEILAHEIGHHVLAPANLSDHGRMIARMRAALPTLEREAPMVANLYTDLLINDRLERSAELRIDAIYRLLSTGTRSGTLWRVYLRIYEVLWSLERGSLGGGLTDDRLEGDAWLGARLIRSYRRDWLDGSGRFAALLLPHLLEDSDSEQVIQNLLDAKTAGAGGDPVGLTDESPDELTGAIHPAEDPELNEHAGETASEQVGDGLPEAGPATERAMGQARQPFEYAEILRALGMHVSDHDAAVKYYKERALPHLVPFPRRRAPQSRDPLPEGLEPWDIGSPLDHVDWLETVMQSPRVVPGVTTVQRAWGTSEGASPDFEPLDLDLYVDSSGSMANPQKQVSFPALAGAVICLSALRVGARVQATLWSGKKQFTSTPGFVRDETAVLRVLTGFFGGGTAFPIHVLRETFRERKKNARPVHVLVISDDGVTTLFARDELGNSGWDVARVALERARGGGTLVLNLYRELGELAGMGPYQKRIHDDLVRARDELGFSVHRVASWDGLIGFARAFARLRYVDQAAERPGGSWS